VEFADISASCERFSWRRRNMRRKSIIVLVTAGLCLLIYQLPGDIILDLTLGSLAIAFSGWLLNKRKATKPA